MHYGIYKNVRDAAWQCLVENNISSLPVSVVTIANTYGIKILKNSLAKKLAPSENGASILNGNKWFIIYDDENTVQRCRFTIAHELGHIVLGHSLRKGYYTRTFEIHRPQEETEADMFAARLLAPACVLWGLTLHTPDEIAIACNISKAAAKIRAVRMEVLYKRNSFLKSPLEREVYSLFSDYIKQNRR